MKKNKRGGYGSEVQGHMVGNISESDPDFGVRFTLREKAGLYTPKWSKTGQSEPGYEKADRNLLSNRPRLKDK
tara:strand:- start:5043 stop:5261 length:219 start_codon:yes stop_codon:yes gene_type:complete